MRLGKLAFLLITYTLFFMSGVIPVHTSQIMLTEGANLIYKGARIGTAYGPVSNWTESIKVLTYNQTTLIFQRTLAGESSCYTIKYQEGFPIYVDYLPNLIYLPPQSLVEGLRGNLDWATKIKTLVGSATIVNSMSQNLNFTVETGSFQCINLTLTLTGVDYGTLSFLYDLDSGILIYQRWVPVYGDVIMYELASTTLTYGSLSILNIAMPSITVSIPAATLIHQAYTTYSNRRKTNLKQKTPTLKNGFPKKPFYILLASAVLNIIGIFLPWSQYAAINVYLVLSLPPTMGEFVFFPFTDIFLMMSLVAHGAAILASLSIPLYLYANNKLAPQLTTIISSILSFISAFIFIQTKWISHWGLQIMIAGGILSIIGIATANIKIEIITEEPESEENHMP